MLENITDIILQAIQNGDMPNKSDAKNQEKIGYKRAAKRIVLTRKKQKQRSFL